MGAAESLVKLLGASNSAVTSFNFTLLFHLEKQIVGNVKFLILVEKVQEYSMKVFSKYYGWL